ncbi:putative redoxin domain-containing protein [Lasiodiplodia theobromae]|uniref:Peroxiredoxin Q n=1 Tax=Lasiodiplodia theobromae TaxID=45133 RepID=A0A5N5DSI0_9PEZI|nr:Redoxin family protein [Lasiodiplodia theobromae]KAB2580915.1 Peroxiredoxin Q [Lasiodiplodia theobromae]KAF4542419.1 Redoxin family protein [Lasiodiplodia theobromae]KAF9635882.1 putative redoxin domain-containing protein [Lasiodiplodia theobromae]
MDPQQQQQSFDRSSEDVLPPNLPRPVDDHKCDHLWSMDLPSLPLPSTNDETVDLSKLKGLTVVFCYPRTGKPKESVPEDWDAIPGARGCTPQACSFKAATSELKGLGISRIFGLSTQETEHQKLTREHLRLGYHLLSDEHFKFCEALSLPMFEYGSWKLVRRVSLVIQDGKIVWVDYPVFPPDKSAEKVVKYLKSQPINNPGQARCGNGDKASSSLPSNSAPIDFQTVTDRPAGAGGVTSPAPVAESPKRQGPASNLHICPEWVEQKAREAAQANVAQKDKSSNSLTGEIAGPNKKYSFHLSGGCTTN